MRKVFYGWYVAVACGLGLACGLASVITGTFSIFLGPLRAEFGWTPSQTFTGLLLVTAAVTIAAPFMGSLVDRFGAKRMILVGFAMQAAVIASFATQTESLLTFYARYIALAILGLGTTHVAFARVISVWFDRRRGLALGMALAGLGVGGIIWPLLSQWAITEFGWRTAYVIVALSAATVGILSIGLVVRESPLSLIDLRNLVTLSEAGAIIMPAAPSYYSRPRTLEELIDFFIVRVLDQIGLHAKHPGRWGG